MGFSQMAQRGVSKTHPNIHPNQPTSSMTVEHRRSAERRSGKDRRQIDNGPPTNFERRRAVEARQPEVLEVHMSEDEIRALGFVFEQTTASVSG